VANLPANTILLVDEAYIHFGESPDLGSALPYVRQAKDVIVTRTSPRSTEWPACAWASAPPNRS